MGIVFATLLSCYAATTPIAAPARPALHLQLPMLFTDNMVLQQNANIPIWGTAHPYGLVVVELDKATKETKVSSNGHWRVDLPALSASGPYELRVIGADTIAIKNVMVGEVWLCSGQSNMAWPLAALDTAFGTSQEITRANFANLRIFDVGHVTSAAPLQIGNGSGWKICSPTTIASFSAVAYFFGKNLHEKLGVPIGRMSILM
ncbi:MAG: hypothetical protein ACREOO_18710 [bacterium]